MTITKMSKVFFKANLLKQESFFSKALGFGYPYKLHTSLGFSDSYSNKLATFFKVYSRILKIEDYNDVFNYFLENNDKQEALLDITQKIIELTQRHFGNETQIFLKVNHDPEYYDEYLIFDIRKKKYPPDFYNQIPKLRAEYYNDLQKNNIWILVTTDLKPI